MDILCYNTVIHVFIMNSIIIQKVHDSIDKSITNLMMRVTSIKLSYAHIINTFVDFSKKGVYQKNNFYINNITNLLNNI